MYFNSTERVDWGNEAVAEHEDHRPAQPSRTIPHQVWTDRAARRAHHNLCLTGNDLSYLGHLALMATNHDGGING